MRCRIRILNYGKNGERGMMQDKEKEKNKVKFSKNICSYYKRKKLKKNEYWIPNPFAVSLKTDLHVAGLLESGKKEEKEGESG